MYIGDLRASRCQELDAALSDKAIGNTEGARMHYYAAQLLESLISGEEALHKKALRQPAGGIVLALGAEIS